MAVLKGDVMTLFMRIKNGNGLREQFKTYAANSHAQTT